MNVRGFTLMEILVALALLAILAVSLAGQSARQLAGSRDAGLQMAGLAVAENELNRVLARRQWPPLGRVEYGADFGEARFTVRLASTATDFPLLRRIEVAVVLGAETPQERELVRLVGFRGEHLK